MKTMNSKIVKVGLLICFSVLIAATSCKKKDDNGTANLTVKMMDDPGDFDTVSVEVLEVQVHYSNEDESGWTSLETEAGNYDLLLLQDSVTATLTEDFEVPIGDLQQMRLILGTNNYVIVDDEMHPLELSSQDKTGLKMNLNTTVADGDQIEILFDFDVEKSIVITGSGTYKLKPVLKVEDVIIF